MEKKEILNWSAEIFCAVTVCDTEGNIIYMNKRSHETFDKNGETMEGRNLMPCHSERSVGIIKDMLEHDHTNCYTITKHGVKKLIFQTPWHEDGVVKGLVELSMVIPEDMPHYDRDTLPKQAQKGKE